MDLIWIARGFKQAVTFYLTDTVIGLSTAAVTFLLAARFDGIGEWSRPAILFLLGYGVLVRSLQETFFGFNVGYISRRIGRGQLDHSMVQPVPLWMGLMTEGFLPFSGSGTLLPALGLIWLGLRDLPGLVTLPWLLLLGLNLVGSLAVMVAFTFAVGSIAFWAPRGGEEINSSTGGLMHGLKQFPLDGVGVLLGGAMLTVVPVGFLAWYPARALVGLDPAPGAVWVTPVAAVAFCAIAAWIFTRGLEQYGRTGSSRYLAWGFRR